MCIIKISEFVTYTPYVLRCNVNRSRGEVAKASITFRVPEKSKFFTDNSAGSKVEIFFDGAVSEPGQPGTGSVSSWGIKAFTGYIKRVNVNPSTVCAGEIIVTISAEDELFKLRNRRITRRRKQSPLPPIAFITSVHKRTHLAFDDPESKHDIDSSSSPIHIISWTFNIAEWDMFVKVGIENTKGPNHPLTAKNDPRNTQRSGGIGGGAFILHDHTSLDLTGPKAGGPSAAVFGIK